MSDLPDGWERTHLRCVVEPRPGKVVPGTDDPRPYLSLDGLVGGASKICEWERASEYRSQSAELFPGDVVYSRLRPYLNKVALADRHALGSSELIVLPGSAALHPGFLVYLLSSAEFVSFASAMSDGDRPRLKWKQMGDFQFGLPPLTEQRRIVEAIEEHFSRLDAAEEGVRRVGERTAGFRRRVLSEILGVRSAPSLDDESPVEPLPAGWAWRRAGDVCTSVVSGSTPKAFDMSEGEGDVPFIKVYNVQFDGSLDFTIKPTFITDEVHRSKLKRSVVAPGDVLTNIVGPPLGKMSIVPDSYPEWNINQAIAAFKPSAEIDGPYLSRLLLTDIVMRPLLRTGKATAGQINLNISSCRRVWLPVPPRDEQRRLVSEIDAALSLCDQLHHESRLAQGRSASLRRSILAAAFAGRLMPQDPSDEPASVLLDRVASERAVAKSSRRKEAAS